MHMEILTSISMSTEEKVSMLRSPSLILGFWFSPLLVWSNALTSSSHSLQRVQQLSLWCSCSTHHSVPPAESQDSWCVWDGHVVTYVVNWLGVFEERKTVLLHKTTLITSSEHLLCQLIVCRVSASNQRRKNQRQRGQCQTEASRPCKSLVHLIPTSSAHL